MVCRAPRRAVWTGAFMSRSLKLLVGSAVLAAGTTGSLAQNISNETWLGQVGGTNTITIDQSGRNNQAGANNTALRLNQDGNDNALTITQFGHRNQVGAAPFSAPPTGINQFGGSNRITINQRTAQDAVVDGGNVIGAIFQRSAYVLLEATNILTILQSEEAGNGGAANHGVGTVRQIHAGATGNPNEATITQTGGGSGEGNYLGDLYQFGAGNVFSLAQRNQGNELIDVRQIGSANTATVEQGLFAGIIGGNLVEYLHQFGLKNVSNVVMLGSNNAVQRILQINAHLGLSALGNVVKITLGSEDSGSTGNGNVDDFASGAARDVSAAQANVVQIGDYNRASITIAGTDNKFGARQIGDDNDAIISIGALDGQAAQRNESAIFQDGIGNDFSHTVLGNDNVGAVRQFGDRNRLSIEQRGHANLAEAVIVGNGNNREGAFAGVAASALSGLDLRPGDLFQKGLNNTIRVNVAGNGNRFAFHQDGVWNVASSTVVGWDNQLVVVQIGNDNTAITQQYGNRNVAVIRQ